MPTGFAPLTVGASSDSSLLQNTLLEHFTHLSDPRIDRTKNHLLLDIVAIAILAVIAPCRWLGSNRYFRSVPASLVGAISSAYLTAFPVTIRNAFVFARLDRQQFQQCFRHWINALTESLGVQGKRN